MKDENKEAMLSISALRDCTDDTLRGVIVESEEAIFALRQQNAKFGHNSPIAKPHLTKAYRRQIARCKTILLEK